MSATLSGWSVSTIACEKREMPYSLAPFCFFPRDINHLLKNDQSLHSCLKVHTNYGVTIYTAQDGLSFCCGPLSSNNTCAQSTNGSITPFNLDAGRVIFNRTSGSITPNASDTATVTVTSATATPFTNLANCRNPSTSSNKVIAVGVGVGVPLGLALLGTLGLLWSQRSRARRETRACEEKYYWLRTQKREHSMGVQGPVQELEHEDRSPDEIDGRLVYEIADRAR